MGLASFPFALAGAVSESWEAPGQSSQGLFHGNGALINDWRRDLGNFLASLLPRRRKISDSPARVSKLIRAAWAFDLGTHIFPLPRAATHAPEHPSTAPLRINRTRKMQRKGACREESASPEMRPQRLKHRTRKDILATLATQRPCLKP